MMPVCILLLLFQIVCLADFPSSNSEKLDLQEFAIQEVETLLGMGKYAEALPIARQSVENWQVLDNTNRITLAVSLNNLGLIYFQLGQYTNAEPQFLRALQIRQESIGSNHLATIDVLANLTQLYGKLEAYPKAAEYLQKILAAVDKKNDSQNFVVGTLVGQLAWFKMAMGDYKSAETLYSRVADMEKNTLGSDNFVYQCTLRDQACLYLKKAEYIKAEAQLLSVSKYMEGCGEECVGALGITLNALGLLYDKTGDFMKAEVYYRKYLSLLERSKKPDQTELSACYNNIGLARLKLGDFSQAESFLLAALKSTETPCGTDNHAAIEILNNLASLYREMCDYQKAKTYFGQAINIHEKYLNTEDPRLAALYMNAADVNVKMGEFSNCEILFQKSLEMTKRISGENHPDTAVVMREFADMYKITGQYEKAGPIFQRVLEIEEDRLGTNHPDYFITSFDLGVLHGLTGDYIASETLLQKSLTGTKQALGTDSIQAWMIENSLVLTEIMLNHQNAALDHARNERRLSELMLGRLLSFTSANQRSVYKQYSSSPINSLAQLGSASDVAEALIRCKGIILDSQIEDELAAKASKSPNVRSLIDEIRRQSQKLNYLQLGAPKNASAETLAKLVLELEVQQQKRDELQKDLAKNIASLGQLRRALRITVPDVQSQLASNAVLLEFIHYLHYLGKTDFESRYGVVLIGNLNEPVWVPLGSAKTIERDLKKYEQLMRGEERGAVTVLKTLYSQMMEPVLKQLSTNITTLIISPDAELNFLSFATLVDQQDKFLAESYHIKYVASGRDLVYGRTVTNNSAQIAAFANPAFDKIPGILQPTTTNAVSLTILSTDQRDYKGISLSQLPNTAQEADFLNIHSSGWHLKAVTHTGTEATEAEVKSLHSPYILHLATHGFFLPDTETTNTSNLSLNARMPVVLHNPMHRSGLALAGAQLTLDAWKRGETPDTENDGILMAQEVALMDLQNTWLVTLSACDTGVGEARAGEGVMGLRRGFIQAGCQNLLMTLWPVSDKWTVDLMKGFYERAMKTGNAPEALAEVQREYLKKLKAEKNVVIAARLAGPFVMSFQGKE